MELSWLRAFRPEERGFVAWVGLAIVGVLLWAIGRAVRWIRATPDARRQMIAEDEREEREREKEARFLIPFAPAVAVPLLAAAVLLYVHDPQPHLPAGVPIPAQALVWAAALTMLLWALAAAGGAWVAGFVAVRVGPSLKPSYRLLLGGTAALAFWPYPSRAIWTGWTAMGEVARIEVLTALGVVALLAAFFASRGGAERASRDE